MKYHIEQLKNAPSPHKFLFFWGHQPEQDGSIGKGCLSQWWPAAFEVDGIRYPTAEHWMMAQKALLFGDEEVFQKICTAATAPEAKKLGREVRNYQDDIWVAHRYEIVKTGNAHKFSQNEALATFLLQTRQRILAEASPVDPIWGIGMAADNPNINDPTHWQGLNLLGFALMEVREQLAI
jgi:ribA/ribD-fused uncharacterized protein